MATHVNITPAKLTRALHGLQNRVHVAIKRAFVSTAQFGVTATQGTIRQTKPKPYASGSYVQSLAYMKTKDGAAVGFSARHSIFVEAGRAPGRPPPVDAILLWMELKGIKPKRRKRLGSRSKQKRSKQSPQAELRGLAFGIARKIGEYGTKPRLVLQRTMPAIQKVAKKEIIHELHQILGKAGSSP